MTQTLSSSPVVCIAYSLNIVMLFKVNRYSNEVVEMKSLDNASNRTCGVNNSTLGSTVATVTALISNVRALLLLTLKIIGVYTVFQKTWCQTFCQRLTDFDFFSLLETAKNYLQNTIFCRLSKTSLYYRVKHKSCCNCTLYVRYITA